MSVYADMPRSFCGCGDGTSEKTGGSGDMAKVPIKQVQFNKAMFRALKAVRAKRKNFCSMWAEISTREKNGGLSPELRGNKLTFLMTAFKTTIKNKAPN